MTKKYLLWKRALRTALLILLLSTIEMGKMYAQSFTVGDLNYSINSDSISVTLTGHVNGTAATGELIIPDTINYEGRTYSVSKIGVRAFQNCIGFTGSLQIPNTVTSVSGDAFDGCTGFDGSLTIGNSVTGIYSAAFRNCSGFSGSLTIGSSVEQIFSDAFRNCSGFTSLISLAQTPPHVWAFGIYGMNYIPAVCPCGTLEAYKASYFGRSFDFHEDGDCPISFADANVKAICVANWDTNGDEELSYNEAAAVTDLGDTFRHNEDIISFDELQYFTGLTSIGYEAFAWCNSLVSIIIPNTVTSIGFEAFFDCWSLASITIPYSVTSISTPFEMCESMSQIVVDAANPIYDSRENCNAIIETNTNKLIFGCKNTIFPSSVTIIESGAFRGCIELTSVTIPSTIDSITGNPFTSCYNLAEIIVEEGNVSFDSRNNCNAIIKTNSNTLVSGCMNTIIPNSVTSIGNGAFMWCRNNTFTSIVIPESVTTIGNEAFFDCDQLTSITVLSGFPPMLGYDTYGYVPKNIPVYVPFGTVEAYQSANGWNEFNNYQECAYTSIPGYGEGEGNWRFIASPLVEDTNPTTVDNMITETEYDLYLFDQSAEDGEWQNYKADTGNFVLENGQGYLYANAEDVNLIFKGNFNEDDTKEVSLVYDANATLAGWNLVGNPFPVSAYANKSYYTMNEDGTAIEPVAVSMEMAIPACTGVMVKAEAEGETVVFSKEVPEAMSNKGCLQIALSQVVELVPELVEGREGPTRNQDGISTGSMTLLDKAIVSFNANDGLEKFVFNKDNASLSIPQGGKDYAIAYVGRDGVHTVSTEVPVNFKAKENGTYTLTVNVEGVQMAHLHLIDNLTGADIDLLHHNAAIAGRNPQSPTPSYTFTAKTTDYASRFRLVFAPVCEDADDNDETFAFISNGNIIITNAKAGAMLQILDVTGRIIVSREGDAMNRVSTSGMTPGVYVLRLINGDDVKMQKIVIE